VAKAGKKPPKRAPVQISFPVPAGSEAETVTRLPLPGSELFVANYVGRPFGYEDLMRAGAVGANPVAPNEPFDIESYLDAVGLRPALEITKALLIATFGVASSVTPSVEPNEESGDHEIVFGLRPATQATLAARNAFVEAYVDHVPRPAGLSPLLVWNPPQ
jgi:hypothetical protein